MRAGADFKSTRLVGRSAWNDRWIIVIPASAIDADREKAMNLIEYDQSLTKEVWK